MNELNTTPNTFSLSDDIDKSRKYSVNYGAHI